MNTDAKSLRYFAGRVTALRYLLDCCDLKFLCVPLPTRTICLCP